MNEIISIALATYNGSKFIDEMLSSIAHQTLTDFVVHVCDDGSTDNTIEHIKRHKLYVEGRVKIHETSGGNGALRNFKRAIEHCSGDYIALCDQDDYWLPEKLDVMLTALKNAEERSSGPKLAFSDLEIVDAKLKCIFPSFYTVSDKSSDCRHAKDYLISNHIPGCSMLFNKEAKQLFEPIPVDVRMHDWWIALLVATYGEIIFVPQSLIKYRQHESNTIGASDMISQKANIVRFVKDIRTIINRSQSMLDNFRKHHRAYNSSVNPINDDFMRFVNNKITLTEKVQMFRTTHSGEGRMMTFIAWWFI
jgi:glycosyltransferase involved in cell wall biosynthesis